MPAKPTPPRTTLQTDAKTHERVRKEALKRSLPVWVVSTLLLNHALDSIKAGDLTLTGPALNNSDPG